MLGFREGPAGALTPSRRYGGEAAETRQAEHQPEEAQRDGTGSITLGELRSRERNGPDTNGDERKEEEGGAAEPQR
jgi:hypothetical protein